VAELLGKVSADLDACRAIGLPAAEADRLLALVRRHLAALDGRPFPVVGAHPDFQPDNLLVGSRGVTVLDFTSFCYAPPVSDVARFVAALMFLEKNPVYSPRTVTRLLSAFLDGYGQPAAALNPALTVYVVRFTVQAAATVRSWRLPGALRRLIERQVIRHTTSWCRDLLHRGEFSIDAAR
jgi:Ser/Thr protein kinase RdoA (MazF antagonist)